jgi:predicted NBD/HSP70 family sugar kinase
MLFVFLHHNAPAAAPNIHLYHLFTYLSMYENDNRVVITLDAGGTNLVFGAMRANKFIVDPITLPSRAQDLDKCLETMVEGFRQVIAKLDSKPVAISFAFPGPADYPNGVIGGYLPNFPSFRDGVALGPFLADTFGIPVFINNDGDLFAYGEALGGALPEINARLEAAGSSKRYHNLLGYTFGTGLGVGMVVNDNLNRGDNSCVETFCLRHKKQNHIYVEEGAAIRAIKRVYGELSGNPDHGLEPKDICEIADGKKEGNREAALKAFAEFGEIAGDAIATGVTLVDGLIVVGGGLTGARKYFMPSLLAELRGKLQSLKGEELNRVQMNVFDLDNEDEFATFAKGSERMIKVYGSERTVPYDPMKRVGITVSKLGASQAISIGAYAFALSQIDAKE